jgi:hypothetical protein
VFEQMTIEQAMAQGRVQAQACADRAERVTTFDIEHAKVFVLGYLASHGPSWGEDIVDAAKATGRHDLTPHDGRAWGVVFKVLVAKNQIRCTRSDGVRRHGHGTAGARQWALVL